MSTGIWSAASGAVGQIAALDSAAQNIANATTPGFKAEEAVFRQTLVKSIDRNTGTRSLRYAVSRTTVPDFRAGQMVQTGRPLDVAITDDKSFFMVSTPQGERYTRAGSFRMSVDGRSPPRMATRSSARIVARSRSTPTSAAAMARSRTRVSTAKGRSRSMVPRAPSWHGSRSRTWVHSSATVRSCSARSPPLARR